MTSLFTSESVTSGHPDKLCDAISDAIVDACLAIDSNARVAVETLVKGKIDKGLIVLAGEVSLNGNAPDYEQIARDCAESIGYNSLAIGFDSTSKENCDVETHYNPICKHRSRNTSRRKPRSRRSRIDVRICL